MTHDPELVEMVAQTLLDAGRAYSNERPMKMIEVPTTTGSERLVAQATAALDVIVPLIRAAERGEVIRELSTAMGTDLWSAYPSITHRYGGDRMISCRSFARGTVLKEFVYRGQDCTIHRYPLGRRPGAEIWVNGYVTMVCDVAEYDDPKLDNIRVSGGFAYFAEEPDGRVTLGFDTGHAFDGPHTQNQAYVEEQIKLAVDQLIDAGLIEEQGGEG